MKRRHLLGCSLAWALVPALGHAQSTQSSQPAFTSQQLDQMLAPIALYPDSLLAQTLMAATYPLEVVQAARWSKDNPNLKGDAAVAAVKDKDWDFSVKSLVAFPQTLSMMNQNLDWTQKVGDAMIGQQKDVADAVQRLMTGTLGLTKLFNTEFAGSIPNRHVPAWWATPATGISFFRYACYRHTYSKL